MAQKKNEARRRSIHPNQNATYPGDFHIMQNSCGTLTKSVEYHCQNRGQFIKKLTTTEADLKHVSHREEDIPKAFREWLKKRPNLKTSS
jgi:hypothetical protein